MTEFDFRQFISNPNQYPDGTLPKSPAVEGFRYGFIKQIEGKDLRESLRNLDSALSSRKDFMHGAELGELFSLAGLCETTWGEIGVEK